MIDVQAVRETGVSPVVGVILMVAVTVLLSVVVFSFTTGLLGGATQEPVTAAVSVDERPNTMVVQSTDMGNADRIIVQTQRQTANITVTGGTVHIQRIGCRATVIAERDGKRQVLRSFFASVDDDSGQLVSYWAFEDCQVDGNNIIDATGKKSGTINDSPTLTTGVAGDAFNFDGDDDRILIGSRGSFRNITVSVWVKPTEDNGWIGGNGAKWRIRDIPSSNEFQWWVRKETTIEDKRVSFQVSAGEDITGKWWHLVGTYNSSSGLSKLYVNGDLKHTENYGFLLEDTGHKNMVIADSYSDGNDPSPSEYDNATIDEFRIYKTELSNQTIQSLCEEDAPTGHPCAGS